MNKLTFVRVRVLLHFVFDLCTKERKKTLLERDGEIFICENNIIASKKDFFFVA